MGSRLAARFAGYRPKAIPINPLINTARRMDVMEILASIPIKFPNKCAVEIPRKIPRIPPNKVRKMASRRN